MTLEEVGSLVGCTGEWVRQLLDREGVVERYGSARVYARRRAMTDARLRPYAERVLSGELQPGGDT
jgi:hypothetical protein